MGEIMKILIITKKITTLGGVQRTSCVLANALNHDVVLLSDDRVCDNPKYEVSEKVKRVDLNDVCPKFFKNSFLRRLLKKLNRNISFLNNKFLLNLNKRINYKARNVKLLSNYINKNNFDFVIASQGELSMYLAFCNIESKKIGWMHSMFDNYYFKKNTYYYGQSLLFKKYLNDLDEIVVLSRYDKNKYKKNWNIDVNAITNIKSFESIEKSALTNKTFLAAGRFNYEKGFDILINAFYKFHKKNKEYKLIILGDGELEEEYDALIIKYKLQNFITIKKNVSNIQPYLLNCCGFIMPSRWEGLGLVMVEAFETGVPVIAFDLPTIRDYLISYYNGIKCARMNSNCLSNAMNSYVELNRIELQKNCIETSKKFDEEVIIEKWNEIFKKYY